MMKTLSSITLVLFFLFNFAVAQNYVLNPGFETLTAPVTGEGQIAKAQDWSISNCSSNSSSALASPDLFSRMASINYPNYGVPVNKFAPSPGLNERNGLNQYAGIWSDPGPAGGSAFDERILGKLNAALPEGAFNISGYFARGYIGYANQASYPLAQMIAEVVLRNSATSSCAVERVVLSGPITQTTWQHLTASFSIPAAEANQWNRIEVRLRAFPLSAYANPGYARRVLLIDDLGIVKILCPGLNPGFTYVVGCPANGTVPVTFTATQTTQGSMWQMCQLVNQTAIPNVNQMTSVLWNAPGGGGNNTPTNTVYTVQIPWPVPAGTYYIMKHGVFSDACPWGESRQVLAFPTLPIRIETDFLFQVSASTLTGGTSYSMTIELPPYTFAANHEVKLYASNTQLPANSTSWGTPIQTVTSTTPANVLPTPITRVVPGCKFIKVVHKAWVSTLGCPMMMVNEKTVIQYFCN